MAVFYLVRHGEADYSKAEECGFWGFGRDFAPLSGKGIEQAENAARDERLKTADIIVSSPYTRALQTAQIISYHTGIKVVVEEKLHEWQPDLTNQYKSADDVTALNDEFTRFQGVCPEGECVRWETMEHMRVRMREVVEKYADYEKVIIVGHGMSLRTLTYIEELKPAGIVELDYESRKNRYFKGDEA